MVERTPEERILSGLSHIAVLFSWGGLAYLVIVYIMYKPKSAFLAAHASQGLGMLIGYKLLNLSLTMLFAQAMGAGFTTGMQWLLNGHPGQLIFGLGFVGLLFVLIFILLFLAVLVMALTAAVRAWNGKEHRYPVIGRFIARIGG